MTANCACAGRAPPMARNPVRTKPITTLGNIGLSPWKLTTRISGQDPSIELRQPALWHATVLFDELIHQVDSAPAPGNHRQLSVEALEVELANETLMALAHEKAAGARLELFFHELELPLREPES